MLRVAVTVRRLRRRGALVPLPAVLLLAAVVVVAAAAGAAQESPASRQPPDGQEPSAAQEPPAGQEPSAAQEPVPVPEPSATAMRYYRSGNLLWVVSTLWGFAVPCLLLFTGWSARLRTLAQRIGRRWLLAFAVYLALFTVVAWLLDLPLSYYAGFVRPHAYGLSNQTFAKWLHDSLVGTAVGLVASVLFLWVPYLLLRRSPRRWWLYTGLASFPFVVFALLVSPIWIDPLFNDFGPMQDKTLEADILALAQRAGIEGGRVFEVNKSVDTEAVNAYVTGLGDTKRIVLWDTIIAKLDRDELLFVMGHEMGHYVLGHIWVSLLLGPLLVLAGLYTVHRSAAALIRRYRARFGFDELADFASLPLMLLLVSLVAFLLQPLLLGVGRHLEHEADRFGLELTHDNHAAATAFVKLQQENLSNPRPGWLYKLWRSSHPPLGERIDFCNEYRPWQEGRPLRYAHHFTAAEGR